MATERKPVIAGNWKMHHDHFVAIQVVQKLSYRLEEADYEACDVVVCPPFTDLRTLQTLIEADRLRIQLGAQNCSLGGPGRVHRRGGAADAGQAAGAVRDHRPLGAPAAVRRDRRDREPEAQGGAQARHDADRVRRGDPRGARGRVRPPTRVTAQTNGAFAGVKAADAADVHRGLRADLGDRHRPQRHARRTPTTPSA